MIRPFISDVKKLLFHLINTGVDKEPNETKQKYIMLSNIINLSTSTELLLVGIAIMIFTSNLGAGMLTLCISLAYLFPVYLNIRGYFLTGKVFTIQFANIMILIMACLYSHKTYITNYYFATITASCFLFSYAERKWLFFCTASTLFCYTLEATPLNRYLPAYNLGQDVPVSNIIILGGNILIIVLNVFAYIYIMLLREKQLIAQQQRLMEVQKKLVEQNDDIKTFSTAASHSMQTPLHVSVFFLEKIKACYYNKMEHADRDKFMIVESCISQMDKLVTGLFCYNRIINMKTEHNHFNMIAELEMIKKRAEACFPWARVIIPEKAIHINSSQLLFSIIIQSVVDNGLKYNQAGAPVVSITLQLTTDHVTIIITDNGVGIEQKYLTKIFEPFIRVNAQNHVPGNGLGLSGAKRAAERLGGRLFCLNSTPGKGSCFQLDLPLKNIAAEDG